MLAYSLAAVGVYRLASYSVTAIRSFYKYCVQPRKDLVGRYGGGWALITGASDGIGKAFAMHLAK